MCCLKHIRAIYAYPTNFNMLIKKHVTQSNEGTYLAIPHLDLGGNNVHKFDSVRRLALLGPSTHPRFHKCSYRSLSLFYTACHKQNIVQRKTEFCIGFKLPIQPFKIYFSTNSLLICLFNSLHTSAIIECISSFPNKDLQKYQLFLKEVGECLCSSGKTIGFQC